MNIVDVQGRIKNKKDVILYIHRIAEELKINRMYTKSLTIKFSTKLEADAQGYCWGDEDGAQIDIARTSDGENLSMEDMMLTLAHELVHAKQYIRGELNGYSGSWMGKKPRNYKYENEPWEKEAYGLEEKLYKKCWL